MFAIWLHTVGARIIALPFRVVIGLVFINQGYLNMVGEANAQMLLDLGQYGLGDFGSSGVGMLLILAGLASIVGIFVRPIGAVLFVVVITNLFAGLTAAEVDAIALLQNRMLLAMCSLILFFLGSGVLSFDSLIFRGVHSALKRSDEEAVQKAKR